jgi:hypothetical protein
MQVRVSSAQWQGSLKEGSGRMALGSGTYTGPGRVRGPLACPTDALKQELRT